MFGSYFRFVRHESKTSCREFDISTKDTYVLRPQHASSTRMIKLYTKNNSNCGRVIHVHSSTHLHSSTLMYCQYTQVRLRVGTQAWLGCGCQWVMAAGRLTALSRAVTTVTVTWMRYRSHELDADESRREHAEYHRLCCKTGAQHQQIDP